MERRLIHQLKHASLAIRTALDHALADLDLTPAQYVTLDHLAAAPGCSSAELARRVMVSPQSMHTVVADLERQGLVARQPRPGHGTILELHMTEQGQQLLTQADARARTLEERVTADLDQHGRHLHDQLQHCIDALDIPPADLQPATRTPTHSANTRAQSQ